MGRARASQLPLMVGYAFQVLLGTQITAYKTIHEKDERKALTSVNVTQNQETV